MNNDWIPVTERYPDMNVPVFVWFEDAMPSMAVARYWRSSAPNQPAKWYLDNTFYGLEIRYPYHYPKFEAPGNITHWQPLPGAPK